MIFGSVCSGIEAASVAWHPLGWRASFVSEIDAFPRAVLAHHYPDVPLHGDFTTIEAGQYADIDVLVGGTPCQSFSVAGLRKGLADERGNLALEFCRLAQRLGPRWVVWENVPGVLSLDGGRAFASILGGLAECGYGLAYRVLDAQFVRVDGFGRAVPQRRRRVFVVGYLGDWRRAAAVLFERESLSGNPAPRRQAGQGASPTLSARTKGGGGLGTDFDCDGGLFTHAIQAGALRENPESGPDGVGVQEGIAYTLEARAEVQAVCFGGNNQSGPIDVATAQTAHGGSGRFDFESETFVAQSAGTLSANGKAAGSATGQDAGNGMLVAQGVALRGREDGATAELTGDVMTALRCGGGGGDKPHVLLPFDETQITSSQNRCNPQPGDPSHPLASGARPPTVAFRTTGNDGCYETGDVTPCLNTASDPNQITLLTNWRVRRLTPRECERLQGFPDDYTAIPYRRGVNPSKITLDWFKYVVRGNPKGFTRDDVAKIAADGPRYKALGNSMAVNAMRWIGTRIQSVDDFKSNICEAAE